MQARDVMTTQVTTVHRDTPVPEIARLLLEHRISAVPVVDAEGRVEGIVSEGDLMRRHDTDTDGNSRSSWWLRLFETTETAAERYIRSHGRVAGEVMTRNVVAVDEDVPLSEIALLLEEKRIKRVPVIRDGRLVGIVSRANLLRALASRPTPPHAPGRTDDQALRERLLKEIGSQPWAAAASLDRKSVV